MKYLIQIACLIQVVWAMGQDFSEKEKLQGYRYAPDALTFIFDPSAYAIQPEQVVVTGTFRGWDQNMQLFRLSEVGDLWLLQLDNPDYSVVPLHAEFKFRVNDGEWLSPPDNAPNQKNGNLEFMYDVARKELIAEIRTESIIWASITGGRPLEVSQYRLTDAQGNAIKIAAVLPNTATETLIKTAVPIDRRRVYYLEIPGDKLKAVCSYDGWFRELYSDKPLGANVSGKETSIRVFAPRATDVKVYLYQEAGDEKAFETQSMVIDQDGVWEITFPKDLHGIYYDFTVHGFDDPGNHFYETEPVHITDPYARVSDNTWGKGRIWRATQPATPLKQGIPDLQDVIAYEVHVQDFTDQLPVAPELKGTFGAMVMPGLKNSAGAKIGFDYLLDLGINTVHLMPVQEYLHHKDADWKASFENDPYMIEQGVSEENYQWGYRTSHFFAVESKYRTRGKKPGVEREEFRDLVQAFHDRGIAVIIDIVPNHTAENMDGNGWLFNFNALDKIYYYRTRNLDHIGEYGNEVKTENRPMVQRWLIDQCQSFIQEFGIDGFRIDLAGQIDEQTLIAIKKAIGEDKILYGEPWIGSNDPAFEANPDWDWYKSDAPITFFQDEARNAYKGPVFELNDKTKDRGWAGGKYNERPNVMKALAAKLDDDKTPLSGISYLDIHDNFALADQFGTQDFDGRKAVDQGPYKIATTLLYTTLGPIVTHGGSEIMRSKAHAPLMEVVKTTNDGIKAYFHGKRDTYNHRIANQFIWEQVGSGPTGDNQNDYANMYAFWKGLNALRLSEYGEVFRVADAVADDYYQFIAPNDPGMLGYVVNQEVVVLLNANTRDVTFEAVTFPKGKWKLIGNETGVDHIKGVQDEKSVMQIKGGLTRAIPMSPTSLKIWVKER